MKIVHVIPGSGGTFYCQNCMRDNDLIKSLIALGHEVYMVPMYLPLSIDHEDLSRTEGMPVFYGAVNMYLKDRIPLYRHAPRWLVRLLDSGPMLRFAARKAGSTRASGLEEMTLSMLRGEEGRQAEELDYLVRFLGESIGPDIIHLSNALLLGLARRLKYDLGAHIVCSLQDENEWIDPMRADYRKKVWSLMAERAADVDMFVASSRYYADLSREQLNIPLEKLRVVEGGIDPQGYELSPLPFDPPVIGYLCRMSEYFGLGIVVDAFLRLKRDPRFGNLRLHLTGGYTGDDRKFVDTMLNTIGSHGFADDVVIFEKLGRDERIRFLKTLTLLTVPVPSGEAFGAYQVEALAAGVPIVQPNVGGYPEFIEKTGGGVIYEPNDGENLARAMAGLLAAPETVRSIAEKGRQSVLEHYTMRRMAQDMEELYRKLAGQGARG